VLYFRSITKLQTHASPKAKILHNFDAKVNKTLLGFHHSLH